jgi:hypothetical protein
MQDVLNSLMQAQEQLKALIVAAVQSDADVEEHLFTSLKALRALIEAVKQAAGL